MPSACSSTASSQSGDPGRPAAGLVRLQPHDERSFVVFRNVWILERWRALRQRAAQLGKAHFAAAPDLGALAEFGPWLRMVKVVVSAPALLPRKRVARNQARDLVHVVALKDAMSSLGMMR